MRKHLLAVVAGIFTGVATLTAFFIQISETQNLDYAVQREITERAYDFENLKDELNSVISERIASAPQSVELAALDARFEKIENKVSSVESQTLGLRQAINPSKPEEILTIARLTDEVKALRNDMGDLRKSLSTRQEVFQDSVLREIKSSNNSTTLILVVLIPLVINFLYTVWKDIKSERNSGNSP